jgi:hypothetical protein
MARAAFLTGDLGTTDSATQGALASAKDPALKAAVLYQRALLAERRGDRAAAVKAGQDSLALHEDRAVRAWLSALQSEGAAPAAR